MYMHYALIPMYFCFGIYALVSDVWSGEDAITGRYTFPSEKLATILSFLLILLPPGLQYYPYRCFPGCLQSCCLVCVEHGRQSVFSSEVNLYYIVMHVFLLIFLFYLLFLNCYYVLLLPNLVNSKKCG